MIEFSMCVVPAVRLKCVNKNSIHGVFQRSFVIIFLAMYISNYDRSEYWIEWYSLLRVVFGVAVFQFPILGTYMAFIIKNNRHCPYSTKHKIDFHDFVVLLLPLTCNIQSRTVFFLCAYWFDTTFDPIIFCFNLYVFFFSSLLFHRSILWS